MEDLYPLTEQQEGHREEDNEQGRGGAEDVEITHLSLLRIKVHNFPHVLNVRTAGYAFLEFLPHPRSQDILLAVWFCPGLSKATVKSMQGKNKGDPS